MLRVEKFDGTKTYMFPNGAIATPDVIRTQFPFVEHFPAIIEVNGNVCQAVQELGAMRNYHGIDSSLTDADAIAAIEVIINTPASTETEITAAERIAAALEFQNLMSL